MVQNHLRISNGKGIRWLHFSKICLEGNDKDGLERIKDKRGRQSDPRVITRQGRQERRADRGRNARAEEEEVEKGFYPRREPVSCLDNFQTFHEVNQGLQTTLSAGNSAGTCVLPGGEPTPPLILQ